MWNALPRHAGPSALLLSLLPAFAAADVGVDLSPGFERDRYDFTSGTAHVDWARFSITPWWSNDEWRVEAELPWLRRMAEAQGTFYVHRLVGGQWTLVPVTGNFSHDRAGIGDSYVRSTRTWSPTDYLSPYITAELKLPTGNPDSPNGTVVLNSNNYSTAGRHFTFGNGSTDLRLSPGLTLSSDYAWITAEGGYIWSHPGDNIPMENRPAAYGGIGLTPLKWLELTAEYDYEGPSTQGAAPSKQFTYTLKWKAADAFDLSLSTYKLVDAQVAPSANWTLSANLHI